MNMPDESQKSFSGSENSDDTGTKSKKRTWSQVDRERIHEALGNNLDFKNVSKRPGPGKALVYIEHHVACQRANEIFGATGWSDKILKMEVMYQTQNKGRWNIGVSVMMQVSLENGCCHTDMGWGDAQNSPHLGDAMEKAIKQACSDARKRCLRVFGPATGLSLYDKGFQDEWKKHKTFNPSRPGQSAAPPKFNPSNKMGNTVYGATVVRNGAPGAQNHNPNVQQHQRNHSAQGHQVQHQGGSNAARPGQSRPQQQAHVPLQQQRGPGGMLGGGQAPPIQQQSMQPQQIGQPQQRLQAAQAQLGGVPHGQGVETIRQTPESRNGTGSSAQAEVVPSTLHDDDDDDVDLNAVMDSFEQKRTAPVAT